MFAFATTAELEDNGEIVGQQRAIDAIQFSIGIQHEGYNLYVLGPEGAGKFTTVVRYLEERAAQDITPGDLCYVFNFEQPDKPRALRLSAGQATTFAQDMRKMASELASVLPAAFTSDEYQSKKRAIEEELRGRQTEVLERLREQAKEHSIALLQTPGGFAFAPLKENDEVISPDEFMRLPVEEQKRIETEVIALQESLQKAMQQAPQWQRETYHRIEQLNKDVAAFAVAPLFDELREKYAELPAILEHLDAVRADVVENFEVFLQDDTPSGQQLIGAALGIAASSPKAILTRYEVNVLVDNSETSGAPVVYLDQPRYQNLFGRVEHVSQMGALVTDFTLIKAGALHRANGGYLLLDARKLLTEPFAWEGLKHALRSREIRIESLGQVYSLISTVSLEPEAVPLDVKVVLLGERLLYYLLSAYDPEFGELFKVAADFSDEMPRDEAGVQAYARLIGAVGRKEKLRPLDRSAVARVVEHSSRLAADAERLSTHMQTLADLLREADYWAGVESRDVVIWEDVQKALDMQQQRSARVPELIKESILRRSVLVDTDGAVVGQINGLSVYALGGYLFGRPNRITARVRMGKGEVIDIERQVDLGGPTHSKGVLILSSFLGARYAFLRPLSLSASLVFEQSYSGVDGDSASSAELYALLSALSQVPIKQSLAVTGSVNQLGQVQAIGGVNEKIEGFFDICRARGLTGEQGVLIPSANVQNLVLRRDVVEAVREGQFSIYPISTVDEGISILTGVPAGEPDENGDYPPDSVNGRVVARLTEFAEKQRASAAPPKENEDVAAGEQEAENGGDEPKVF